MRTPRRRRLVIVVLFAAAVAGVAAYRGRRLQRSSSEFLERYGS
jgi:hypothetical protein